MHFSHHSRPRLFALDNTGFLADASPSRVATGLHVRITKEALLVAMPRSTYGGKGPVSVRLIDIQGRCACTAVQRVAASNGQEVMLNTRHLARGTYFLHVNGRDLDWTSAITLVR